MARAKVGIIGGSGLGEALCGDEPGEEVRVKTPFGQPSDALVETRLAGTDVVILNRHGPGHLIHPSMVNYRANIYALKAVGCTHVIASGAVGSLRERIRPKDLVIADQVIDKTCRRVPTFFDEFFAAHVEFAWPFCPVLRRHLLACADAVDATVHDGGTYVCMEGPAFSTRAESEMHRAWGGDLVGMTCMPEAKLAREAELAYAIVCLPSDYDCWRPHPAEEASNRDTSRLEPQIDRHELLREIIANLAEATQNAIALIRAAVARFDQIARQPSPAHSALELAIWSKRELIAPAAREKFGVLIAKYL